MPAVSKKQQKLFGLVRRYQKGDLPNASQEIKDLAKSIKKKVVKEFAETKHKNLPNKKRKKKKSNLISYLVKLANTLDEKGLTDIADLADHIINTYLNSK